MTQVRPLTNAVDELVRAVDALVEHLPPAQVAPFRAAVGRLVEEVLSAASTMAAQAVLTVAKAQEADRERIDALERQVQALMGWDPTKEVG